MISLDAAFETIISNNLLGPFKGSAYEGTFAMERMITANPKSSNA
jgi:hypothetical protein